MFTHVRTSFEWSLKLKCKLWGQDSQRWYVSDRYGLLITVGCVDGIGGDFSQTAHGDMKENVSGCLILTPFNIEKYLEKFVSTKAQRVGITLGLFHLMAKFMLLFVWLQRIYDIICKQSYKATPCKPSNRY